MTIDRAYGRGAKLTVALFLLGASTVAVAFLPGFETIGASSALLLALFSIGQGLAMGGVWDGLASLLSLNAPAGRRGWFALSSEEHTSEPQSLMCYSYAIFCFTKQR